MDLQLSEAMPEWQPQDEPQQRGWQKHAQHFFSRVARRHLDMSAAAAKRLPSVERAGGSERKEVVQTDGSQ